MLVLVSVLIIAKVPILGQYVGSCCSTSAGNILWLLSLSTWLGLSDTLGLTGPHLSTRAGIANIF